MARREIPLRVLLATLPVVWQTPKRWLVALQ
jgi:hypothetical protein